MQTLIRPGNEIKFPSLIRIMRQLKQSIGRFITFKKFTEREFGRVSALGKIHPNLIRGNKYLTYVFLQKKEFTFGIRTRVNEIKIREYKRKKQRDNSRLCFSFKMLNTPIYVLTHTYIRSDCV